VWAKGLCISVGWPLEQSAFLMNTNGKHFPLKVNAQGRHWWNIAFSINSGAGKQ